MVGLGGIDPQRLAKTQEITRNIDATITVDYDEGTLLIRFNTSDAQAKAAIPGLIESFITALTQQLSAFFAISGKIVKKARKGG